MMGRWLITGLVAWLVVAGYASADDAAQALDPPRAELGRNQEDRAPTANKVAPKSEEAKLLIEMREALERNAKEIKDLKEQHAKEIGRQQEQSELQQKQIEVLERATKLLADQVRKQGSAGGEVGDLMGQTATLESRGEQAARRDQELASATSDLRERVDTLERRGGPLPYTLKEQFLPYQANETPVSIYGQILGRYTKMNGRTGLWDSPTFSPWLLVQLNNRFLLEANFAIGTNSVSLAQGQIDWYINNWLTLTAGRFLRPTGFFNERLSAEWINKLPDVPLMFNQVVLPGSIDGLQLRGARYLFGSPLKMEYAAYLGNGLQLAAKPQGLTPVANLTNLFGGRDMNSSKAYGGRLGFWLPPKGMNMGLSGYTNGIYSPGSQNHFYLWDLDASYHRGSWDFRLEYAQNHQEATSFLNHDIDRRGLYVQTAYRNYAAQNRYLRNVEAVFRYGFTNFHGINAQDLNLTSFGSPISAPVNRNQYTMGINYYFYPSMALKLAYEINQERTFNLHDDIFMAQGVWAF